MEKMNIEQGKICYGCMNSLNPEDEYCTICGFHYKQYMEKKDTRFLNPGIKIKDRYLIGKVLGAGGFGITYLGFDLGLQIPIAIKEYFPNRFASRNVLTHRLEPNALKDSGKEDFFESGKEKFLQEARTLARFQKMEGIVSVTNIAEDNNTIYMVMEYLPGKSLNNIVASRSVPMGFEEAMDMIKPVIDALEVVHDAGMIHRDISPDNMVMGENGKLILIDFGAARDYVGSDSQMTVLLKPGYAPLEQFHSNGRQGPWTDIYALCATIYYMINCALPESAIDRVAEDHLISLSTLRDDIPLWFSDAIDRGMAVDYHDRFHSIQELREALGYEENAYADEFSMTAFHWDRAQEKPYHTDDLRQNTGGNRTNTGSDRYVSALPDSREGQSDSDRDLVIRKKRRTGRLILAELLCIILLVAGTVFLLKDRNFFSNSESKDNSVSSTEYDIDESVHGTYVTARGQALNFIHIVDEPGGTEVAGKPLPEGKCTEVVNQMEYDNVLWYQVNYYGKVGWAQSQYFRKLEDDVSMFSIDEEDTSKNTIYMDLNQQSLYADAEEGSATPVTNLPYGYEFTAEEYKNGFARVTYNDETYWVNMVVAGRYRDENTYWQIEICNGDSDSAYQSVALKESISGEAKSLTRIKKGQVILVSDYKNGYGHVVDYGGGTDSKTGWIDMHRAIPCATDDGLPSEDNKTYDVPAQTGF